MALVQIRAKYQVTIPAVLRRELDISPNEILFVEMQGDKIIFQKNLLGTSETQIKVKIRTRFQFTLPKEIYQGMGITVGDMLEMDVEGGNLVATSKVHLKKVEKHVPEKIEPVKEEFSASEKLRSLAKNS